MYATISNLNMMQPPATILTVLTVKSTSYHLQLAATCEWREEAVGMYITICNLNMMRQPATILTEERFLPHPKCDAMTMAPLGIVGGGIDDDGYA